MQRLFPSIKPLMRRVVEPGNIDIDARKVVLNPDGSFSTEESMSFGDETGAEILIPTVVNGQHLSQDAAVDSYYQTGQHLGKFTDPAAAESYAQALHLRQEKKFRAIADALRNRGK